MLSIVGVCAGLQVLQATMFGWNSEPHPTW